MDPSRLVFVDETGSSTASDRTHRRSPSGVRVDGPAPHGHWKVVTLTGDPPRWRARVGLPGL
ncbi:hypothetical protein [Singulisphaera sp. PoT]|uniref:hypothetical protein n=1 Tax=Singulisphaera sp. PoT TaxID=3411797 RepID=UPI003BF4B670